MSAPYFFELIGHVFVAAESAHTYKELSKVLSPAGLDQHKIKEGLELVKRGEAMLEEMLERVMPDNKALEHNMHAAVMEVEIWLQTIKMKGRKAGFAPSVWKILIGKDLHAHDHAITVIGQALRSISYLRALDDKQIAKLGGREKVHNILMRGNTLTKKLYKVADSLVTPSSMVPREHPIFAQFDALNLAMSTWVGELFIIATKIKASKALAVIGHLPDDRGIPIGGTAFNVTLHERAIQAPPSMDSAERTSGWGVGRQGNKENQEMGWTDPTFGSVMGD